MFLVEFSDVPHVFSPSKIWLQKPDKKWKKKSEGRILCLSCMISEWDLKNFFLISMENGAKKGLFSYC